VRERERERAYLFKKNVVQKKTEDVLNGEGSNERADSFPAFASTGE
jgi:hypothetical protein